MNSRKCDICNVDVHRASYQKHFRSKKHLENLREDNMNMPEWLFQEPIENKSKKLDDKQVNKELAKRCLIHITLLIERYKLVLL